MKIDYRIPTRLRRHVPADIRADSALNKVRIVFLAPFQALWDVTLIRKRLGLANSAAVATMGPFQDAMRPGVEAFGNVEIYNPELCTKSREVLDEMEKAISLGFDVLAIGPLPEWSHYPERLRRRIVEEVAGNGRTIVLAGLIIPELETGGVPDDSYELPNLKVEITKCGRGRVVKYAVDCEAGSGFLLPDTDNETDYERALALFSRICAGGEVPRLTVDEASRKLRLLWNLKGCWELRTTADYVLLASGMLEEETSEFELAGFPSGDYVLVCQACSSGTMHVLDFTLHGREYCWRGTSDGKEVVLTSSGSQQPADSIHWQWFDVFDRLLSEGVSKTASGGTVVVPRPKWSLSVANTLVVHAMAEDRIVSRQRLDFMFDEFAPKPDFAFLVWYLLSKRSWKQRLYLENLRDGLGADAICNCGRSEVVARQAAMVGLRTVPYTTWMHKIVPGETIFSQDWLETMVAQAEATVKAHRPCGALGYTLGDECYLDAFTEAGRFAGAVAEEDFRKYLRMAYSNDIAALNDEYGTGFGNWESVRFDSDRSLFLCFDNPSPWIDYRLFVASRFMGAFQRLQQAIQMAHPGAAVGWDGCEQYSSYDGIDWYEFCQNMDIAVVYANTELGLGNGPTNVLFNGLAAKSFAPNARLSGAFLNNINGGCGGRFALIWLLAHGYRSIWQWHGTYPDYECGAVDWRLNPTSSMRQVVDMLRILRQGATALLGHAECVHSPIAIHYSALNYNASTVESGVGNHFNNLGMSKAEFWSATRLCGRTIKSNSELDSIFDSTSPNGHYAPGCKNFLMLCRDLGHQPLMMARQEIEAGKLTYPETRILILPFVTALSDAEVTAIKEFVNSGGMVLADYRTALRDAHGKIRPEGGALDGLFGIHHCDFEVENRQQQTIVEYNFSVGGNWQHRYCDHIEIIGDGCVLAAYNDGTPMSKNGIGVYGAGDNGCPAFVINHSGAGSTLFLNYDIYNYDHLRRENRHHATLELFREAFWRLARVARFDAPRNESGNYLGTAEMCEMRDKHHRYVGIFPDYSIGALGIRRGTQRFKANEHVYDILAHRYLGQGSIEVDYVPGEARLYAALAASVSGMDASVHEGKIAYAVTFADGLPRTAAVEVRVWGPDGMERCNYACLLHSDSGRGDYALPMALNDEQGEWKITLTEVFGGLQANLTINNCR